MASFRWRWAASATIAGRSSAALRSGIFQQAMNFTVGGIFASVAVFALFIVILVAVPNGLFGSCASRRVSMSDAPDAMAGLHATTTSASWRGLVAKLWPFAAIFAFAIVVPLFTNDYWVLIASRAAIYWILIAALNLVVGFAGQLAIGYIALLTLGAYTTSVLAAGNVLPPVPAFVALVTAGCAGAVFGVIVGLPALRLRTFYFAISTLGFATIVTADRARLAEMSPVAASGCPGRNSPNLSRRLKASIICVSDLLECAPG